MKRALLIFLLFGCCSFNWAQVDSLFVDDYYLLKSIIAKKTSIAQNNYVNAKVFNDSLDSICYTRVNLSGNGSWHSISNELEKIIISPFFKPIGITKIKEQLNSSDHFSWKHRTIGNVTTIPTDTLDKIFDSINGWQKFHEKYTGCLTTISKPIYGADSNYCVIQYSYMCGATTGYGHTAIYRKEYGNKWIEIAILSNWIS